MSVNILNLLTCDQINATFFAISDLSAEMIQDQQFTPTALQQHHLIIHLTETPHCVKKIKIKTLLVKLQKTVLSCC